ncbi:MAG TPA: hypothetical protein VFX61_05850 [Micromonosporaceae bacterium]|nr:hypothetical protein [Micromonosporaceae bacterium]
MVRDDLGVPKGARVQMHQISDGYEAVLARTGPDGRYRFEKVLETADGYGNQCRVTAVMDPVEPTTPFAVTEYSAATAVDLPFSATGIPLSGARVRLIRLNRTEEEVLISASGTYTGTRAGRCIRAGGLSHQLRFVELDGRPRCCYGTPVRRWR